MNFLSWLSDRLWDPWLLALFLFTGGYFTLRSGFFQLLFPRWLSPLWKSRHRSKPSSPGGLTQFQALSTALASTIGTGSIAGVATALFFGGPGAVFWMWVSAFLGMMTSAAEKALALHFRETAADGTFQGGPMCYMRQGLPHLGRPLAFCFSLACFLASLVGGGMVQSNSISSVLHAAFGWNKLLVGAVTALSVAAVLFGGIRRVGAFSERVVPVMAALFLGGGALVLFVHRAALPQAFRMIIHGAFHPQAVFGGYSASSALRYGVARGVFTNEAGLGSSAMAHAAAADSTPREEGLWGILEVFVATLLICSMTALVILVSGVYDPTTAWTLLSSPVLPQESLGAPLFTTAFSTVLPRVGPGFVAVSLLLFAFTSLLGWGYYGQRALSSFLPKNRKIQKFSQLFFRFLFLFSILLGSVGQVDQVWILSDLANALMALPNLISLLLLSPKALQLLGFSPLRPKSP